jgi:hypothetical protein
MDPASSNTVAKQHACLTVSTFDPTEVPKELATSFAPRPNASTKAIMKPTMTIHSTSSEYGSIMMESLTNLQAMACTLGADTVDSFNDVSYVPFLTKITELYLPLKITQYLTKQTSYIYNS